MLFNVRLTGASSVDGEDDAGWRTPNANDRIGPAHCGIHYLEH